MNKRIRKKKWIQLQKSYCHPSFRYQMGETKNPKEGLDEWQCTTCGWDSLEADPNLEMGEILWQHGGFFDLDYEVEYVCPVCKTKFRFLDGV